MVLQVELRTSLGQFGSYWGGVVKRKCGFFYEKGRDGANLRSTLRSNHVFLYLLLTQLDCRYKENCDSLLLFTASWHCVRRQIKLLLGWLFLMKKDWFSINGVLLWNTILGAFNSWFIVLPNSQICHQRYCILVITHNVNVQNSL